MIEPVRTLITSVTSDGETPQTIYECRRCGATLETPEDECGYCPAADVCKFEIR